ncbi:MAG TPA: 16S rRNA (cytosine(1402)-N(4))-methyltransferase RsmH [Phycisphaerae bacterium]|nr:16S rRNA (cytosine(1402)-N(4))-methyltransferase RsmH [Phycisphaerae bacterium]
MHIPVLLREVLLTLRPRRGQVLVDCTLGLGGHSAELLWRILPTGHLAAIDFDPASIEIARGKLGAIPGAAGHFHLFHNNFAALPTLLAQMAMEAGLPLETKADGLLADLGVSSPQIDTPERGFSYRAPGPLDMRMDPSRGQPASALVNRLSERELAEALLELGDESDAEKIARLLVERRSQAPIETTEQLMALVCEARDFTLKRAAGAKLHPAARTFQALRILTNRELANLERLLAVLPEVLKPGGVAAVITFHSGEDRRVKKAFKEGLRRGVYSEIAPDPILADEQEIAENKRARSAKLRWARRAPIDS